MDLTFLGNYLEYLDAELIGHTTKCNYVGTLKRILKEGETDFHVNPPKCVRGVNFAVPKVDPFNGDGLFLTELRLKHLFNLKVTHKNKNQRKSLEAARDWLIISCWLGLRYSDLMRLTLDDLGNFKEFITKKKRTEVVFAINPMIPLIIYRNDKQLPKKLAMSTYNEKIKEVCRQAGFDEMVKAKKAIVTEKGYRKVPGVYPFHEVVSSHIGRKSMFTNMKDQLGVQVLMHLQGWKDEQTAIDYDQKLRRISAETAKEYMEEKYSDYSDLYESLLNVEKMKPQLQIVKPEPQVEAS